MRIVAPSGAARAPSCRRALWTTSRRCDEGSKPPQAPVPPNSKHHGRTIDARIKDRDRARSVSRGQDPWTRGFDGTSRAPNRFEKLRSFRRAIIYRFGHVLRDVAKIKFFDDGSITPEEMKRQSVFFVDVIDDAFNMAERHITDRKRNPLYWTLRNVWVTGSLPRLYEEIRYLFHSFVLRGRFNRTLEDKQREMLDFRFPQEWFPGTREMQRTIHVHVGPTNSGKTYNALKALENAKRGVYAGPLRLLATEIYQRFLSKGLPCGLFTGDEIKRPRDRDLYFAASTVEMCPLNTVFDVAVIDEIQMLGDQQRGGAWTTALLGVRAKEVHVCGEERAVKLVQAIAASVGDKCVVHRYSRLNPLEAMQMSLDNDFTNLRKGDAIVAFSRLALHTLKRSIESHTGRKCAIVYGKLPPEIRSQQAELFNDPDNDYDFIVASDAIGMGLNLNIRRIILDTVTKFDGESTRPLTMSEVKQIGGRAGRYRVAAATEEDSDSDTKVGYVTTMEHADLGHVQDAFGQESLADIDKAYITPPFGMIESLASYYPPSTPLSFIFTRIKKAASVSRFFELQDLTDMMSIADNIEDIPMTIGDRLTMVCMPVSTYTATGRKVLRALATVIAEHKVGDLLSIEEIPLEHLELEMPTDVQERATYLSQLETLHESVAQYIWLHYRFAGMFPDLGLAFHIRGLVEQRMADLLHGSGFTEEQLRNQRQFLRRKAQAEAAKRGAARGGLTGMQKEREAPDEDNEHGEEFRWSPVERHGEPDHILHTREESSGPSKSAV